MMYFGFVFKKINGKHVDDSPRFATTWFVGVLWFPQMFQLQKR